MSQLPGETKPDKVHAGEGGAEPIRIEPVRVTVKLPVSKPWVTYVLMGVTIAVFLGQQLSALLLGFDLPALIGAGIPPYIVAGQVWRLFTPALLHMSWLHIAFNMFALYSFGRSLEQVYGHGRFFLLYLLGAFGGNVASFWLSDGASMGASTAIFGMLTAKGIHFFINRKIYRYAAMELESIAMVILINLFIGLSTNAVNNWGHLGGLLSGAVFAVLAGPILSLEGFVPDLRLVDRRGALLPWLVALVEAAAITLIASFKLFPR